MTVVCDSAAAYVLGALSASERAAFESHLADCTDCRQAVAELAGIPGLLSRVSPDDLADPIPVPDTLVPGLLRSVRRAGRRRRLVVGALSAAAVLVAIAGTALVVDRMQDDDPRQEAMTAVVDVPVTAAAALQARSWGTEITMDCEYTSAYGWSRPYALVAVNDSGDELQVATWSVGPSGTASINGSVPWQPEQIDRIEIQSTSGTTLLRLVP